MIALLFLALFAQAPVNLNAQPDKTPSDSIVPKGTGIPVALANRVSTKNIQEGANVYATTVIPISDGKKIVIPTGTTVLGKVVAAERAGRVKGKAQLTISFQSLVLPSGLKVPIYASLGTSDTGKRKGEATIEAEPGKDGEDIAVAGGKGAATGAVVGALSRGVSVGKGAAIGGAAGVAGGLAEALIRRGDDLELQRGTIIEIVLDNDVDFQ